MREPQGKSEGGKEPPSRSIKQVFELFKVKKPGRQRGENPFSTRCRPLPSGRGRFFGGWNRYFRAKNHFDAFQALSAPVRTLGHLPPLGGGFHRCGGWRPSLRVAQTALSTRGDLRKIWVRSCPLRPSVRTGAPPPLGGGFLRCGGWPPVSFWLTAPLGRGAFNSVRILDIISRSGSRDQALGDGRSGGGAGMDRMGGGRAV